MASQGSDDTMITAAIVKQMQANMDKKRKDKESKLLKLIQRDIDDALNTTREQFAKTVNDFQAEYENFQLKLAEIEDGIRKTWVHVAKLFDKHKKGDEQESNRIAQAEAIRRESQEQGLQLQKNAIDMHDRQCRFIKTKVQNGHMNS
ncbi:hypothetical protein BKA62DRAFT_718298 [Auriculariales sp. MPI-PUGE-AT-0066]|nr:hypothetical protein BKA62DRAFT_718298 [Auriculariales sp. MPI-PUGE-AT-0066]